GVYNYGPADEYVAFGEKNKMFIIGHTLVWHNQCPPWFCTNAAGKPNTKEEQIERLRSRIEAVAGRYAGRVNAWDVVNEVIGEDGNYRPTTWVNAFGNGDTLVKYAFMFAAKYAPNTELYYNDFNEVIGEDGNYRPTTWVNAFGNGDTLVKYAFMFAAKYAPNTELYYNDFNE